MSDLRTSSSYQFLKVESPEIESFLLVWERDIRRAASYEAQRLGESHLAEDLAQEVRLRLIQLVTAGKPTRPGYVRRVIANSVRTARRHARFIKGAPCVIVPLPAHLSDQEEDKNQKRDFLVSKWTSKLPARLYRIYSLIYECGFTQEEVASVLGVTQSRVAQLHRNLLDRARVELEREVR